MGAQIVNFALPDSYRWGGQPACAGHLDMMFPTPEDHEGRAAAKAMCARCPVLARCRDEALERGERDGVWGGLDADERRSMRRSEARKNREKPFAPRHPDTIPGDSVGDGVYTRPSFC